MPAHELAKVVVYHGDNGYGMLVLPADHFVDFEQVLNILSLDNIHLASESDLRRLFPDCALGAMPPFGILSETEMPVLVDQSIADAEYIAFTAGTHQDVIRMKVSDFRMLASPLFADFAVRVPAELVY